MAITMLKGNGTEKPMQVYSRYPYEKPLMKWVFC